ncbi:MAG: DUF5667 domain-containing protein, partial [Patescibacteria group bacterium]
MEDRELINKIQLLKEIKPTEEWVLSCRSRLAFRMEMARKKGLLQRDLATFKELFSSWTMNQPQPAFRAIWSVIIAFGLITASGAATTWAAMQSAPGNFLYPVKLALEKVQIAASFSDNQVQMRAEIADKRFQELEIVMQSQDSMEQKTAKVSQVMLSL